MTNEPKAGKGLDPEMLAAYIDNRLPPEQRASVEAELANDPDSYAVLVETIRALDEGSVPEALSGGNPSGLPVEPLAANRTAAVLPMPARGLKTRGVFVGSVLAVAAGLAMVVWLQPEVWQRIRGGEPVDPLMAKLVEAVGEERYIEARLTGGFKYGPLRQVTRGPGDLSQQNLALLAAAGQLQERAQEDPSAENLHAWGVAQLATRDYEGAIVSLTHASKFNESSRLLTDLAAAYITRAKILDSAEDAQLASDCLERALALAPSNHEAVYNRAIAASMLGKHELASVYWRAAMLSDPAAEWREEAKQQFNLVSAPNR